MVKQSIVIPNVVKENVDIEEAIDEAGHGRYNIVLLFTCCILNLGAVMDMLGYSMVVPAASCDLNLTLKQSGILKSIPFAGFLFALPWGYTADTRGRRRTILVSASVGFIISAISSFSTNFYTILVLKFLASSFTAQCTTLTIAYVGECTCKKQRARCLFVLTVFGIGADLVAFSMAYFILPLNFAIPFPFLITYKPWRLLTLMMAAPVGVGAVMLCFLQESPKFLANKGNTEKALEVLTITFKVNNGADKVYAVKSLVKTEKFDGNISFWESVVKQTVPIFKPPLGWRTFQLFLLYSICCSTNNVFFMWFPTMVNSFFNSGNEDTGFCQKIVANITPVQIDDVCIDNQPMNTIYAGILFSLLFTTLNTVAVIFANWRRTLIITTCLISAFSCIFVDIVQNAIGSVVLFVMIQLTGICYGSVQAYYVDIFPTSYSGLATSLGIMVARFFCIGGVTIIGATIVDYCRLTFFCWAVFIFIGVILTLLLPGDTPKKQIITKD